MSLPAVASQFATRQQQGQGYATTIQKDPAGGSPGYQSFPMPKNSNPNRMFHPNGNLDALREQGKLSDPATKDGEDARYIMREKKYYMPGYTGFVRGSQHISARTYGELTRRANDTDYETHARTSPIPSGPQCNRKIIHADLKDTFVANNLTSRNNHVPGYTGHVPGTRGSYAKTFGETTIEQRAIFQKKNPRKNPQERPGYAATSTARDMLTLSSEPIPGETYVQQAPTMLVPGHVPHPYAYYS